MNFYDFMDRIDKFTIEHADDDFRNMEVITNKIGSRMFIGIKYHNDIGDEKMEVISWI